MHVLICVFVTLSLSRLNQFFRRKLKSFLVDYVNLTKKLIIITKVFEPLLLLNDKFGILIILNQLDLSLDERPSPEKALLRLVFNDKIDEKKDERWCVQIENEVQLVDEGDFEDV